MLAMHSDDERVVRLLARPLDDGRVEVGLQQRSDAHTWGEIVLPDARFLRANSPAGEWRSSSALQLPSSGRPLVCVVTHGAPGDRFWEKTHAAMEAAASASVLQLRIENHEAGLDRAAAIRSCVADGAVAIATTLTQVDALSSALAETKEAGVRLVTFNSGEDLAISVGSRFHISLHETVAGRRAGEFLDRREFDGAVLCVIHESDNLALDRRCDGLAARVGREREVRRVAVHETGVADLDGTRTALSAALDQGGVGAIVTLNGVIGHVAAALVSERNIDVMVGTFGSDESLIQSVADGDLHFVISDQPVIQATITISTVEELLQGRWSEAERIVEGTTRIQIDPVAVNRKRARELIGTPAP